MWTAMVGRMGIGKVAAGTRGSRVFRPRRHPREGPRAAGGTFVEAQSSRAFSKRQPGDGWSMIEGASAGGGMRKYCTLERLPAHVVLEPARPRPSR